MGGKALCCGSYEPPTSQEAVPVDGGGAGGDRLRIGSETQWDHSEDLVSPQGTGGGGAQGLDHQASQRKRWFVDLGGGLGPEGGGGEGASSSSGGGGDPSGSGAREVAHCLPEVLRLCGILR